jgi:hypothetical protein
MHVRLSRLAPAVLAALTLGVSACEDSSTILTATMSGPSRFDTHRFAVEPSVIAPEFLAGSSCRSMRPFHLRFNFFVQSNRQLFLRGLRFQLIDRSGGRALPVPIPTSPAVATPGQLQFHGVETGNPLGLTLKFDCGVFPTGTLLIDADTADDDGITTTSRMSVTVAQP